MPITPTDLQDGLKELYLGQDMEEVLYEKSFARPFYTRVKKNTEFEGEYYPLPVMYEDVGGGSSTFVNAQTNEAAMELAQFQCDVADYHRVVQVKGKALRKVRSNVGAFLKKQQLRTDSMLNALANDLENSLYRSSTAVKGTIAAIAAGVVSFAEEGVAKLFQKNDVLGVTAAGMAGAARATTATITVVDVVNNELTISPAAPVGWIATDLIFRDGDYVSAGDNLQLHGLADWVPATDPVLGVDSFQGEDRGAYPIRLAGHRFTGSLATIEDDIVAALTDMWDYLGAAPDVMLCSGTIWRLLAKELGIEVRRDPRDGKAGMEPIAIMGPSGRITEIIAAPKCQVYTSWLLTMDTWELISAGDTVGIFDDDGNLAMRVSDDDSVEWRGVSYPELCCHRPGDNARITWS